MDIANPRRVLAVCSEEDVQHLSKVLKDLTGKAPETVADSLAGTTHDLLLKTPYYTTTVPIWIDLIADSEEWSTSFLTEEAQEVLSALGGLMLIFAIPPGASSPSVERTRKLISDFGKVVKKGLGGWEWDGVGLAVGVGEGQTDEWDEMCAEAGLEFVKAGPRSSTERNEFGEKTGVPRIKEALESNDWAQLDDEIPSDFGDFEDGSEAGEKTKDGKELDPESLDFGFDKADFEGMRKAIWENNPVADDKDESPAPTRSATADDGSALNGTKVDLPTGAQDAKTQLNDDDVVQVERMMRKLQAVREAGEGMGEEQRRRMAARAVKEVMADLED